MTLRIDASFNDRLHRLRDRGRDGEDAFSTSDLTSRDAREFDWGLGELYAADSPDPEFVIENTHSLAAYREAVAAVFDELLG